MRLLVMLQNAWGGVSMRSRKEWIDALLTSRSGLRLAIRGRVRRERLQTATPSPVAHMSARKEGT